MDRNQAAGGEESGEDAAEGADAALDTDTDDGMNIVVRAPNKSNTNGSARANLAPVSIKTDDGASVKTTSTKGTKPPPSPTQSVAAPPEPAGIEMPWDELSRQRELIISFVLPSSMWLISCFALLDRIRYPYRRCCLWISISKGPFRAPTGRRILAIVRYRALSQSACSVGSGRRGLHQGARFLWRLAPLERQ